MSNGLQFAPTLPLAFTTMIFPCLFSSSLTKKTSFVTMGSFISSAMDDNMKKQQVFMVENQVTMLERNMNMQNAMRERMMATQVGLEMIISYVPTFMSYSVHNY